MVLSIRKAKTDEVNILSDFFHSVLMALPYYNEAAKKNETERYLPNQLREKIIDDEDSIIIALQNNEIVGFCMSRKDDMVIWLEWFGVQPSARRKGVARQLVKTLEQIRKKAGFHKIWCDCRTENLKSIQLLSSASYTPICTIKNHWYGQDFILWQKEI